QAGEGRDKSRRLMRRTIIAELVLVVGILGVVGLWRFTPPPRALLAAQPLFTHVHTERLMADITGVTWPVRSCQYCHPVADTGRAGACRQGRFRDAVQSGERCRGLDC